MTRIARLNVPMNTVAAVRRGHPWVFRDRPWRAGVGEVVNIADDDDRIVGWGLFDDGPIAIRVLGRGPAPSAPGVEIGERIRRAHAFRRGLLGPDTNAYRVVAGEGDGLSGLVVDRYDALAVVRLYGKCWEAWLPDVVRAVADIDGVALVYRRFGVDRVDGMKGGEALHGADPADTIVIAEHGMRLLVRPKVGQKTGLFLDQREHRRWVRGWSRGRSVANLFAYNGGFSVAAALGGATRVVSIDIAADAIDDARENFRLNGLDPGEHAFEVTDAFSWRSDGPVGLLIVDPPSLSHDKGRDPAARRAYEKLHAHVGPQVALDGLLATSSCTARLPMAAWIESVEAGLPGSWSWHAVSREPLDHPIAAGHVEGFYLKFGLLRRRAI